MSDFVVFTTDGRASLVLEQDAASFIVGWKEAVKDLERPWPYAYIDGSAVHFNPDTITAVSVKMGTA